MLGASDVVINEYLTDTDAWFLQTDAQDGLKFFVNREMAMDSDNDFDLHVGKFTASMRFAVGWTDFRGIYGSPGAA